jgi:hypothetical protein
MKTILALIVSIAAVSAQAVSFNWTSKSQVTFDGTILKTEGNTAKAYLVYLGTDNEWSFGNDISGVLANITDTSVSTADTRTSGSNAAKGKIMPTDYAKNGNQEYSYGVVLTYKDSSNKTWYNISSDVYTIGANVADNATGQSHEFEFSFEKNGTVAKLSSSNVGGGWVAVPEPSTAALALAGLALLLKRRKA